MQGAAGESSSQASTGISHLARPTVACERAPGTHSSASARRRRRGGCSAGGCWCRVGRARLLTRKRMLRLGAPRRVVRCYHRRLPCSLSRWEDGSGRPTVLPSPSPHGPRPSLLLGCWCRELDGRTRGQSVGSQVAEACTAPSHSLPPSRLVFPVTQAKQRAVSQDARLV